DPHLAPEASPTVGLTPGLRTPDRAALRAGPRADSTRADPTRAGAALRRAPGHRQPLMRARTGAGSDTKRRSCARRARGQMSLACSPVLNLTPRARLVDRPPKYRPRAFFGRRCETCAAVSGGSSS